jgi:hypothetical protein
VRQLIERFRSHNNFAMLALVGVQPNQSSRALDIARPFRTAGIPVAIGGFHVSGCVSMVNGRAVELDGPPRHFFRSNEQSSVTTLPEKVTDGS